MGSVLERKSPSFDQLCPNIEFLKGSQPLKKGCLRDGLMIFYRCNPLSSVFDLEDEDIQVNRFVLVSPHLIAYLELDRRNTLSPEQIMQILIFKRPIQRYSLKYYARRILVS